MFITCRVVCQSVEDRDYLVPFIKRYPITMVDSFSESEVPTLIVGWYYVKQLFPDHNIFDKQINEHLFWTYSKSEDDSKIIDDVESFININIKKFLPSEFLLFDPLFTNSSFDDFVENNIKCADNKSYVYFHKDAMYIHNACNNFIINLNSLSIVYSCYKDIITEFLNSFNCVCYSYKNFSPYINIDKIGNVITIENLRWVKFSVDTPGSYFNIIPGFDIHKHIPFIMRNVDNFVLNEVEAVAMDRACKRDIITEWLSKLYMCFNNSFNDSSLDFLYRGSKKFAKVEYTNKKTLTGRITVKKGYYDPQRLDKSNDDRANIISRFDGGSICAFDYQSFESRIALFMSDDEDFIAENFEKDLHYETAKIVFGAGAQIDVWHRDFSKVLNHAVLYGASRGTVLEKLKNFNDPVAIYESVRYFLKPLLDKFYEIKKFYVENEFIINKYGSIVRPKSEKEYASFNNYIQSTATEIVINKLFQIKELLKKYRSKLLFQVHDSLVFDLHPAEIRLIDKIGDILREEGGMRFVVGYKTGPNFKDLSHESFIF